MFEINLIKDRVVPRNLGTKRLVIVGSFIGFMLVITLFIGFFGMQVGFRVQTTQTAIANLQNQIEEHRPRHQMVVQAQAVQRDAERRKQQLFSLWDGPVHFGAAYRHLVVGLKNHENLRDKAAVVHANFRGRDTDNELRIVVITTDHNAARLEPGREGTVANIARQLARGDGAASRLGFAKVDGLNSYQDVRYRNIRDERPTNGGLMRIAFRPSNPIAFNVKDGD